MAFDVGAGLAEAGKSIATTAQAYTLESQKAELEQQKAVLADQLAGARQDKQNVFTAGESAQERANREKLSIAANATALEGHRISAGATISAAGASAAASRYSADRHLEATRLGLEAGKIPAEVNLAKFITDPNTTPEQRALVIGMVNAKTDKNETFAPLSAEEAKTALGNAYEPNRAYQRGSRGKIEPIGGTDTREIYTPLSPTEAKKALGDAYDSTKAYQKGSHGKIEPIGGSMVNITNQTEAGFSKTLGEQDAKRVGEIQENTKSVIDTAAKVQQAADLFGKTYTGPVGQSAQAFFKTLGALPGFEKYADMANIATAGQAIISDITPKMRVPGSGSTSDYEMRVFGAALPSLLNLPGGNELVSAYWQKIAERSLQIQGIAEKYAKESKSLTGTDFSKDVVALGPLFSKDELSRMRSAASAATPPAPTSLKMSQQPAAPRFTKEDYDRAPSGTVFTDPNGLVRVKP